MEIASSSEKDRRDFWQIDAKYRSFGSFADFGPGGMDTFDRHFATHQWFIPFYKLIMEL